jgi:mRNA interferase MazF
MKRGDVVIVDFRLVNPTAGVRPAAVIQNDRDNARMANTIVVQLTTTLHRKLEDTQLLIDAAHPDWNASGLPRPSVVNCSNIYTIRQSHVAKVIGAFGDATMQALEQCLRNAIGT